MMVEIVGNGGIRARKQMVLEIDCIRRGFVKKKRGNEGEVGVGGWDSWGGNVCAGEGFEEGLDCIHGVRVAGGGGFGQWVDVRGVFGVGGLGVGRYGAHKGCPYRWDGEVGEGARLPGVYSKTQCYTGRGKREDMSPKLSREHREQVRRPPTGSTLIRWTYFDGRQNHLQDVAGGTVSLRPSAQLLWRAGAEEREVLKSALVYDSSRSAVSPFGIR